MVGTQGEPVAYSLSSVTPRDPSRDVTQGHDLALEGVARTLDGQPVIVCPRVSCTGHEPERVVPPGGTSGMT